MEKLFLSLLFLFGLMFGSFASVIIYRLRSGEGGMWTGRSHCKTCERNLTALDLIPLFSWIAAKGVCRKCSQKVSAVYPTLEFIMGVLFLGVGIFLIDFQNILSLQGSEFLTLFFWLSIIFFSVIYVFYDILFLEIPESVLGIFNSIIFGGLALSTIIPEWNLFPNFEIASNIPLFWSLFIALIVFGGLYSIMLLELKEIYDVVIVLGIGIFLYFSLTYFDIPVKGNPLISGMLGAFALFLFFFLQILVSKGAWMGGGDLRIALGMGMLLGISYIFVGGMLAYMIGSIIGIGLVISQKIKTHKDANFSMQVPFGPFLAVGYIGIVFFFPFWENIIQVYFL